MDIFPIIPDHSARIGDADVNLNESGKLSSAQSPYQFFKYREESPDAPHVQKCPFRKLAEAFQPRIGLLLLIIFLLSTVGIVFGVILGQRSATQAEKHGAGKVKSSLATTTNIVMEIEATGYVNTFNSSQMLPKIFEILGCLRGGSKGL